MKKLGLNTVSAVFGLIMVLVVLSGAIAITFTDFMHERLYGNKRIFFVLMLLAYVVYRVIRLYQGYKKAQYED